MIIIIIQNDHVGISHTSDFEWNRPERMGKPQTKMTGVWEHGGPRRDCVKTRDETGDLRGRLPRTKPICQETENSVDTHTHTQYHSTSIGSNTMSFSQAASHSSDQRSPSKDSVRQN